ncbi:MAG: hypothetical protein M3069_02755 [Chloroflexota bacterium]|nr:hypothetical protein [Chloroflexota bacterium]
MLGKPVAPEADGAFGETQVLGDGGICLTRGDTHDDLGTIGILLGGSAGGHATLQFRALGRQQPNATATRFGHAMEERQLAQDHIVTRGYWKIGEANCPDHNYGLD